jgi:carbamoyl-phosphate synthase large subunit
VLCELAPDPVIQEHVFGREFTADCLADRDGRASVILRWRLLVKGGLSVVSATFRDEEAAGLVRRVLAAIGAAGPCCVQGIIRDDGLGPRVQFIEANACAAAWWFCAVVGHPVQICMILGQGALGPRAGAGCSP